MSLKENHIAILCSRLDLPGGIERIIVNTANLFTDKGHSVTLLVLDEKAGSFYPINNQVKAIHESLSFGITPEGNVITRKIKLLTDVLKLRKLIKQLKPDIVIATEYPFSIAAVLSGAGATTKLISWEHHHFYELKRNSFWQKAFTYTYPRLKKIVCLNTDEQKLYDEINTSTTVIPNFIIPNAILSNHSAKRIITIGRLTSVKGIDLLLPVAKEILNNNPDWEWKIIGEGEMMGQVQDFIIRENLQQKLIIQKPISHDVSKEYADASLYVMTSQHECFPMTLLEAQSAGLPVISFDCDTGPRHIIKNGSSGILVPVQNIQQLINAIQMLIDDPEKRMKMSNVAKENASRFAPEKIYEKWQTLFYSLKSN